MPDVNPTIVPDTLNEADLQSMKALPRYLDLAYESCPGDDPRTWCDRCPRHDLYYLRCPRHRGLPCD